LFFTCVFVKHRLCMIFLFLNVIMQNKLKNRNHRKTAFVIFREKNSVTNHRFRCNLSWEA
jgi:hypothetical protein